MPLPPSILAFGLGNLPMLYWLAAAAAPIVIHLLSKRRYREMSWAAMEYLLAALKRKSRRLKVEQWLLLAIRTLLIVLLVLAMMEPFWQREATTFTTGGQTHRVLVIDGSYSMAYHRTDKSRFEQAKELARQIVEASREGDAFTLVLMAAPPRVVVRLPALERKEVLQEIDRLEATHGSLDLPATVDAVQQLLNDAKAEAAFLKRHEVYFLTDLGRVGWEPTLGESEAAAFRARAAELAEAARLFVLDVGQPVAENVAITGLRTIEPVIMLGRQADFEVTLKNFGRQPLTRQPVELWIDGQLAGKQTIQGLPPGGEKAAVFSYVFDRGGDHTIRARTEGDALEIDNQRFLALKVRPAIKVLCIDGRPSTEPYRGAAGHLATALAPQGNLPERGPVEVDVAGESALGDRDLRRYDCVFLCEVPQLSADDARVLDIYLKNGGSLAIFLGDGVSADRYNRELGGQGGRPCLLPALVGPLLREPQYQVDPLDFRHPLATAFRGQGRAALLSTPVLRYFRLQLPKQGNAQVALALPSGDPLIVTEDIHRGRVVLVATSASDIAWSPLPLWPSFLPLIQEILSYCISGRQQQQNVFVGRSFGAALPAGATEVALVRQSSDPDGKPIPVRTTVDADRTAWTCSDTSQSGLYSANFAAEAERARTPERGETEAARAADERSQQFAVNLDTAESNLTQLSPERLADTVWEGVSFDYRTTWQNLDDETIGAPGDDVYLQVHLLYAVMVLLFLETLLAWRFGHHAA
jgi:hypothetical protein